MGLHMPKYHDRLVEDMGHRTCRKSNPLFEALLPYNARDYRPIFGLPDRTNWMRLKTAAVLVALLLPTLWAAVACVAIYLLPEEPPSALASSKAGDNATERSNDEPQLIRQDSPAANGATRRRRVSSVLAGARSAASA